MRVCECLRLFCISKKNYSRWTHAFDRLASAHVRAGVGFKCEQMELSKGEIFKRETRELSLSCLSRAIFNKSLIGGFWGSKRWRERAKPERDVELEGNASNARSNDVNRPTVKCVACEVIHACEKRENMYTNWLS